MQRTDQRVLGVEVHVIVEVLHQQTQRAVAADGLQGCAFRVRKLGWFTHADSCTIGFGQAATLRRTQSWRSTSAGGAESAARAAVQALNSAHSRPSSMPAGQIHRFT